MGLVVKALTKFAESNVGTKLYKWGTTNEGQKWLCQTLPLIEATVATGSRVYATEKQKLSRREKNVLQTGHIVPALAGLGIGSVLNKKVFEVGDKIGRNLDPNKVKNINEVRGAIKVALPLLTTSLLFRLVIPSVAAFISGEIEEVKAKKKKLDIKA